MEAFVLNTLVLVAVALELTTIERDEEVPRIARADDEPVSARLQDP
jgi:hypothetical protein